MKKLNLLTHPILKHQLGQLRNKNTSSSEFRKLIKEISRLIAFEATEDLEVETKLISTPIDETYVSEIKNPPLVISIMRAGNGMLDGILSALPFASAGHIGIYRDKFINNTVEYYFKIPEDCKDKLVLLADPLIATASTMIASIDRLKQYEVGEIRILSLLVSQIGADEIQNCHPDVKLFTIDIEQEVNSEGYLVPGMGDAGNRLYNTKKEVVI